MKTTEEEVLDLKQIVRTTCSRTVRSTIGQTPFCGGCHRGSDGASPADTAEGVMRRAEMMTWVKELPEKSKLLLCRGLGLTEAKRGRLRKSDETWD